ncbi:MAG TPA: FAD-dependent monooxygenase, partial [Candidatus Eisenbacteria bacterium]|nr:FAD-dependent monooxygenase [Candidatus Eisenbacteria bacterium]
MKLVSIGGGPAGLFTALLLKKADPRHEVIVYERNRLEDTFGFGVVFSDATEEALAKADAEATAAMGAHAHRWDDIEIHYKGEVLTSTGHRFSGLSRKKLLSLLAERCRDAGVKLCFEREVPDPEAVRRDADLVLGADGANSLVRERYKDHFRPIADVRPNRFVWFGTTRPFPAFTFYFKNDRHGLWRVHAYQYEPQGSTFIVEAREATWRSAGLDRADEARTIAFCEDLFREELAGHRLLSNRS